MPRKVRIDRGTETDIMAAMDSFLRLVFLELYFRENYLHCQGIYLQDISQTAKTLDFASIKFRDVEPHFTKKLFNYIKMTIMMTKNYYNDLSFVN